MVAIESVYNLLLWGSFLIGLIAWLLPIISFASENKAKHKKQVPFSIITSFSLCSIALFISVLFTNHLVNELVNNSHWTPLADIYPGIVYATFILTTVTIAINVIIWNIYNNKK